MASDDAAIMFQWSVVSDPKDFTPQYADTGFITSPFNMEAILRACPDLLAGWMKAPFILVVGDDGHVRALQAPC